MAERWKTEQWPSVGRAVHYDPGTGECLAATIAGIVGDQPSKIVNLGCILRWDGALLDRYLLPHVGPGSAINVPIGPSPEKGGASWHWPEYVGPQAET